MDNEILKALSILLDEKLNPINSEIQSLKSDVQSIKTQLEENTQILRSLEHKADINKSEHDKFTHELIHLSGAIENMRRDLSTVEIVTARNMENIAQLKLIK